MPVTLTGTGFGPPTNLKSHSPEKPLARWQTAGLHPECYSPRRKDRSMQATDIFYKVLGVLWILTVVVFYAYMVLILR